MADATGERQEPLRVAFDRRIKLEFNGARITSDGGLLAYRELDDALGLTAMAISALSEGRRGRNIRHHLPGLLRQAVYGRLAGYQDVNDAERLARSQPYARLANIDEQNWGFVAEESRQALTADGFTFRSDTHLKVPNGLRDIGYTSADIPALVEGTLPQHRVTKLSPRPADAAQLSALFEEAMVAW